ncbi:hypothetical protein V6N13_012793 [Hibiscus sabdariffa]
MVGWSKAGRKTHRDDVGNIQFDEFDGRPPDGFSAIPPLEPLERPSSPTLLEEQSVGKKARNDVDVTVFSDKIDMDADQESIVVHDVRDSAVFNPPLSQESAQHTAILAGDGGTYASKVISSTHQHMILFVRWGRRSR